MSRRIPILTSFVKGPGSYIIRRATLRGKKPPTGIRKVSVGKAKPKHHGLAFLINDPDFPLLPQPDEKLPAGMKRRVPLARTRKEVLARLKALTQLSRHDLGAGSLAAGLADGAIDALALGGATNPAKRKKLVLDKDGNPINPQFLPDPGTTSTSSFASAIQRLHEFGFGSAITSGVIRDAGVITGADLTAEELHDAIQQARQKKKKKALVNGGIEQNTAIPGNGPTALSSVHNTLVEFDRGRERMKRDATTAGAAGTGAVAGAIGGLKHDSGVPIRASDLQPGMRVTKRFGPGGLFQHVGIVDESGRVVHRTSGSSKLRSVKPSTFQKTGRGPLRHEVHSDDLPPRQAAANASRAAGTRAGRYSACQGNNCQDAAERLISKGKPVSRQLRKALGGAAAGAIAGGTLARFIQGHRKEKGK